MADDKEVHDGTIATATSRAFRFLYVRAMDLPGRRVTIRITHRQEGNKDDLQERKDSFRES